MADLTKNIIYRLFTLNDEDIITNYTGGNGIGAGIGGCIIDSIDYNDVDVVQFMEKRSLEDGMDVGDVFKGARRIRIAGVLYGVTRADLYDRLTNFRAALDPVLAQADEPADHGYQPFYFSTPTLNLTPTTGFPTGYIDKRILAMPRALGYMIQRDSMGGEDGDSLAIPWQATLVAADPRITGATEQDYVIPTSSPATGTFVNRGNHYAVLNMLLSVGTTAGSITVQAGTSIFVITIPVSTGNRLLRIKGDQKIITVEEDSVEVTRQDILSFSGDNTWPQVQPGSHGYSLSWSGVTMRSGSHMWFWESYA